MRTDFVILHNLSARSKRTSALNTLTALAGLKAAVQPETDFTERFDQALATRTVYDPDTSLRPPQQSAP